MFEYGIRVVRVVDGDTIEAEVDLGFRISRRETLRFLGVNTPELHSTNLDERTRAKSAAAFVAERLLGRSDGSGGFAVPAPLAVKVQTAKPYETDKYGRWLARVFFQRKAGGPWLCLNDELIDAGHAKPYDGTGPRT